MAKAASTRRSPKERLLAPDTSSACDTSKTVTPMVAAHLLHALSSGARVKNMGIEIILGFVMASPVVLFAAALLWAPEEWLQGFVEVARSLGRVL